MRGAEESVSSAVNEIVADNNKKVFHKQRASRTAGGKRHYVIDYFVIVDFAIYDRCDTTRVIRVLAEVDKYPVVRQFQRSMQFTDIVGVGLTVVD